MQLRDKITAILVAALLAVGYCHDARADGLPKTPLLPLGEVAKAGSWTGFYAYGAAGYGWQKSEWAWAKPGFHGGDETGSLNVDKLLLTAGAGFDLQTSNIVLGILADVTWSDISKGAMDGSWQWFAGARGGVLVTPKTLVYGLVGYTEAVDGELTFKVADTTKLGDLAGLTYGGGIEHMFATGWAMKLEYRRIQLGDQTAPDGKNDAVLDGSEVETGSHQVRVGISKRF